MKNAFEFVCMSYAEASDCSAYFQELLHPLELKTIEKAVEKRRIEFLYGRLCAKYAYAKLEGLRDFDNRLCVKTDRFGAPFFEDGTKLVGITHDEGLAAAIVTDREQMRAGIDVQKISGAYTEVVWHSLNNREKLLFDKQSAKFGRDFLAAAVWAAKEALSKLFGSGFLIYDALEILEIEQKENLMVKFARFGNFPVLVRPYKNYLFGFAVYQKDIDSFCEDRLVIEETPIRVLQCNNGGK